MLLNSNYKKYNLLDLGNAKYYFDKSIPLYCQLSGAKPPVIKNIQYNEQNKNDKYGLQSGRNELSVISIRGSYSYRGASGFYGGHPHN